MWITDEVQLATTYEVTLLADTLNRYTLENVLIGTKVDILGVLLGGPKTISELQTQGFAKSTLYKHLNEIQETGAIAHTDDGYAITDDTLRTFFDV